MLIEEGIIINGLLQLCANLEYQQMRHLATTGTTIDKATIEMVIHGHKNLFKMLHSTYHCPLMMSSYPGYNLSLCLISDC